MKRISISKLKARLSEYLDAVKAGEEVIVTDRGKPVARITPVQEVERLESRVEMLIRSGQARPPLSPEPVDLEELATNRPKDLEGSLLKALLQEREEGR